MANKATTTFTIQAEDKTKAGISSAQSSFKEFTSSIDSITGGMASKVANLVTNPWTAAIAVIGTGVKVTKELWSAGLEAEKGALAMKQAWGTASDTISDYIRTIDRTTLATKEDLEGMAKSLSQYGLSAEEVNTVLQTTADIANKTGKEFTAVESAVVSALNGQDKALKKLIPEWDEYKEGTDSAVEGIKNLGDSIHDSAIQVQSGSIAQTLDNMSSSWNEIKDNLGQTIVMDIQASGILDTIARWLEKIEENTATEAQKKRVSSFTGNLVDQFNTNGSIDWANLPKNFDDKDIPMIMEYLSQHPELYTTVTENENVILGGYTTKVDYKGTLEKLIEKNTEGYVLTNGIDTLLDYYNKQSAKSSEYNAQNDRYFMSRWYDLMRGNGYAQVIQEPWYKTEIEKYTSINDGYLTFNSYLEDRLANPSSYDKNGLYITPSTTTPISTTTPKTTDKNLEKFNSLMYGTTEAWNGKGWSDTNSLWTNIISANWDAVTDKDWASIDSALMLIDGETRQSWQDTLAPYRIAYDLYKSGSSTTQRDHSTVIKPFQDFGMGYTPYQQGQNVTNWKNLFGYNSLYLNGINVPFSGGVGIEDETSPSYRTSYSVRFEKAKSAGLSDYESAKFASGTGSLESYLEDTKKQFERVEEVQVDQTELLKKAEQEKAERDAEIINNIKLATSAVNTLKGVMNTWKDGYQSGDIGSTTTSIGGIVSAFAPKIGAILTLAGAGIGFFESLFDSSSSSESNSSSSNASSVATYNGATTIHINNYFDGSYIVGSGGMEELAKIIRDEINGLSYSNR